MAGNKGLGMNLYNKCLKLLPQNDAVSVLDKYLFGSLWQRQKNTCQV